MHKFLQDHVLFDLDIFGFLLIFCTRHYIYYDQTPDTFCLIIKYLLIFIEDIKNIQNFPFFTTKQMFIYI